MITRAWWGRLLIVSFLVLGLGIVDASAVPLGDLVGMDLTIQQGDKLFSNFALLAGIHSNQGTFTPATPEQTEVTGITVDGNNGLRFSGPFSVDGTIVQSTFSFILTYDVTVTDPSMVLHDVRHTFTASHTGQESSVFVQTSLTVPMPFLNLGAIVSTVSIADPNPALVDKTLILAADVTTAHVMNVFDLFTGSNFPGQNKVVSVPSFDVTFSQVRVPVPEPSSWLLLASGIMGLAAFHRWRGKNEGLRP